ncbi:MAG: YlbF family regulator [Verrucomicrobiaceae bacterium]|nr:YlbF family regulator [Verrucomicrobiaceae bacterium]
MTVSPAIQSKIVELCQTLINDEEVQNARQCAESFLADEAAVKQYREMATLGRALHQKQHHGEEPTGEEITQFNAQQERCEANPVIVGFLGAQETLSGVAETLNAWIARSLESGRVPAAEEMEKKGGCGEGCGCH